MDKEVEEDMVDGEREDGERGYVTGLAAGWTGGTWEKGEPREKGRAVTGRGTGKDDRGPRGGERETGGAEMGEEEGEAWVVRGEDGGSGVGRGEMRGEKLLNVDASC